MGPLFKVETQSYANNKTGSMFFPHSAPKLLPISENGIIDVKGEFAWTLQKTSYSRADVPTLYMREQTVVISSALQNFRYNIGNTAPLAIGALGGVAGGAVAASLLKRLAGGAATAAGALAGTVAGAALAGIGTQEVVDGLFNSAKKEYLKSYVGLYSTKETGFKYYFPVIKEDSVELESLNTNWNGEAQLKGMDKYNAEYMSGSNRTTSNKVAGFLNNMASTGDKVASMLGNIFPAAYIEKPRSYNYGNESTYVTDIKINLYNTVDWENTKRNFELVTLLYYQNLPNRLNPILLDPPVIYEAYIPGLFYSPYCYINKLQITGIGANRELQIPIPVNETTVLNEKPRYLGGRRADGSADVKISSIIPDVYQISFQLVSMIPQTQNLKFQALMSGTSNDAFAVPSRL